MAFTLRQARNLENRLRNLKIDDQIIEVRAYDVEAAREDIEEGKRSLRGEIDHKIRLNTIRHQIKHAINDKNMECGVSAMLNERDALYEEKRILGTLGREDTTDRQIAIIEAGDDDYHKVSVVRVDMVDDAEDRLFDIDDRLSEIQQELNHLNNTVTIDFDTTYLTEAGIL